MKEFSKIVDKFLEYVEHQQQSLIGSETNKWFSELKDLESEIDTAKESMFENFYKTIDTLSRSEIREMIDFCSQLKRAKEIRNKNRYDFFCSGAVRYAGVKKRFTNKKKNLSDGLR